jgi:hypothetical protein
MDFIGEQPEIRAILNSGDPQRIHEEARACLQEKKVEMAWKILLASMP